MSPLTPRLSLSYPNTKLDARLFNLGRSTCKHSFDKESILEYLKTGPKQCPSTGCGARLTISDLEKDEGLARRVKAYEKRQARQDEEAEDNGDVQGLPAIEDEMGTL